MADKNENGNGNAELGATEARAFLAVRHGEHSRVADLPRDRPVRVGRDERADIRIEAGDLGPEEASFLWDGHQVTIRAKPDGNAFVNGKRLDDSGELKPGDEIAIGPAQLVVGLAGPLVTGGRRTLTHHEFRERLYEEMARAGRGGRPSSLVMVQARAGEGGRVAGIALASFRAGDMVGTYAHDELELLLPDTPGETARSVVQRMLASEHVHAKCGLAVAPRDADNPERLLRAARRALDAAREQQGDAIATPPPRSPSRVEPVARDPATKELLGELETTAPSETPVLLTGELSSGKGVFARWIHDHSGRAQGPYVVVRCASLVDDDDVDRMLGPPRRPAQAQAAGARGGTLVLDEVGDLHPDGQKRVMAVLDHLGDEARLIATTQRTLMGLVERGAFERSLHERLQGKVLEVPALRNRPEDIIPLAERFAEELGAKTPVRMSPGALARLRSYPWAGNVLELRNAMDRAVRLAGGGEILAEHLPAEALPFAPGEGRLREHVDSVERDAIVKALADSNYNQTHAARRLGVSRRALIYKMEKYGLKPPPGTARR